MLNYGGMMTRQPPGTFAYVPISRPVWDPSLQTFAGSFWSSLANAWVPYVESTPKLRQAVAAAPVGSPHRRRGGSGVASSKSSSSRSSSSSGSRSYSSASSSKAVCRSVSPASETKNIRKRARAKVRSFSPSTRRGRSRSGRRVNGESQGCEKLRVPLRLVAAPGWEDRCKKPVEKVERKRRPNKKRGGRKVQAKRAAALRRLEEERRAEMSVADSVEDVSEDGGGLGGQGDLIENTDEE